LKILGFTQFVSELDLAPNQNQNELQGKINPSQGKRDYLKKNI